MIKEYGCSCITILLIEVSIHSKGLRFGLKKLLVVALILLNLSA